MSAIPDIPVPSSGTPNRARNWAVVGAVVGSTLIGLLVSRGSVCVSGALFAAMLALFGILAFTVRPCVLLRITVAFFALDSLTLLSEGSVYALTVTKLLALPLTVSCVAVAWRHPQRLRIDPGLAMIACFLVWTFVSWFAAEDTSLALRTTLTYLQLSVLVCAVRLLVGSLTQLRYLSAIIVISLAISGAIGLFEFVVNPDSRITGTSQNAALLSADLCLALALGFALALTAPVTKHRGLWLLVCAVIIAAIAATLSRAAYLSFIPAMLVGAVVYRGRAALIAALIIAACAFVFWPTISSRMAETSLADTATVGHLSSIQAGVNMVADHPVLGVGAGNYLYHYLEYSNDPRGLARTGHNTYLMVASETGIPGLAFFLGLHVFACVALARTVRRCRLVGDHDGLVFCAATAAALAAYVLIGGFHSLHFAKYLWVLLALCITPPAYSSLNWRGSGPPVL